jgi:cytochrome P450
MRATRRCGARGRSGAARFAQPMEGVALSYSRANTDYVLRHHEQFSSVVDLGLGNVRPMIPLNVDPPMHSKYRKLLDPLFAPKRMDEQEADITRRVNGFIDVFIDRGECNFTEEFAELFPSSVFLGLMGLPEEEMRMFLHMRDGVLHPEKWDENALFDPEARMAVMQAAGAEIYEYFGNLIDERRKRPVEDLISRFLEVEIDGEKLSREDILDVCYLFLIAGLDTVSDTLTCSYAFLATHPDHRGMIVDHPAIIPIAVEELLRWESPVPSGVPRVAKCPVNLPSGAHVDEGTMVMPSYGAANMDPSVYDDPLEVRFDRENNPHIAFGAGVHRCLGSHLARRELRISLKEWHRRIPDYRLKPGHEQLEYPPGLRHVKDLTLTWA